MSNGTPDPKWNDIPFSEDSPPAVKAAEFDSQLEENGGDPEFTKTWQEPK